MNDKEFMRIAIEKAREGIKNGQSPFGACIVKDDEVVDTANNTVWEKMDITAHAEVNAIRNACEKLNTIDLSGCTIYSTTEPCPMCFSAIYWARISKIVFGSTIRDSRKFGFNEMAISNEKMKSLTGNKIEIKHDFLNDECKKLFEEWMLCKERKTY